MTTKEKKNIQRLHYEKKYSYAAIGRLYGVSRQRIHQIITGYKSFAHQNHSFKNIYLNLEQCELCQLVPATDMHHLDGNNGNNKPDNLIGLCEACHLTKHEGLEFVSRLD